MSTNHEPPKSNQLWPLLPCPFCGNAPLVSDLSDGTRYISCDCLGEISVRASPPMRCNARWNTRAVEKRPCTWAVLIHRNPVGLAPTLQLRGIGEVVLFGSSTISFVAHEKAIIASQWACERWKAVTEVVRLEAVLGAES